MEIQITFIGLCLFVPDGNGKHVHVLLPKTVGPHRHEPRIFYAGIEPRPSGFSRFFLDLTKLRQGGTVQPLPNALDVEAMVGGKVPVDSTGNDAGQKVALRISLPLADSVVPGPTAVWTVEKANGDVEDVSLTHQLTWKLNNGDISIVDWELKPLSGGSGPVLLNPPIPDTDGVVRIYILHLADHPHVVNPGEPAPHPDLFYAVSGRSGKAPVLKRLTPELQSVVDALKRTPPRESETAYNCMLGKSGAG